MRNRAIIEKVRPELDSGKHYVKRILGETISITADIYSDGHDAIRASVLYRSPEAKKWTECFMEHVSNNEWKASFELSKTGFYDYKIEAWIDHLLTWHNGFRKKQADGQHMSVELEIGANLLQKTASQYTKTKATPLLKMEKLLRDKKAYQEAVNAIMDPAFDKLVEDFPMKQFQAVYDQGLQVRVGLQKELYSTWYEFFPRSASSEPGKHGTFKDCEKRLERVAEMGFDVLYFPPVHPIGEKNRKGKNNAVQAEEGEPGSPWAIGSQHGGHKDIHPALGTLEDYKKLIKKAKKLGIDVALDLAFQCAPDHPYIKEHPEWFIWRPDGTIAYAENPPKKYQDIVPIDFECADWENLYEELKSVIVFGSKTGSVYFG